MAAKDKAKPTVAERLAKPMGLVIECEDGMQLEVIARLHNPKNPRFTNFAELPADVAQRVGDAIGKAYAGK